METHVKLCAICIATSRAQTEVIVGYLHESGFLSREVSVLFLNGSSMLNFAEARAANGVSVEPAAQSEAGITVHGALDWLPEYGLVSMPGASFQYMAAGPLKYAMLNVGMRVNAEDLAMIALLGAGLPATAAKRYESNVKGGYSLIAVHNEDVQKIYLAREIFVEMAANDVAVFGGLPRNQSSPPVAQSPSGPIHGSRGFQGLSRY
jgi:hypothetical protein